MNWLFWKEYRHNRLIVFTTVAILVTPYLIGLGVICVWPWIQTYVQDGQAAYSPPPWREIIAGAGVYSVILSQFCIALLGGNAISGERVDRSSQFLYSLPVTRRKLLASKLLFASIVTAVTWLVNIAVFLFLLCVTPMPDNVNFNFEGAFTAVSCVATTGLTFFCVAWFLSSFVASPAFDVCGGVIAPALVIGGFAGINQICKLRLDGEVIALCYLLTCLVLAVVCFAIGTWYYLRRVEP